MDVTDYVANGSFASLKDNVNYLENGYAILARLVDHNSGWEGNFVYVDEAAYKFLSKSSLVTGDIIISNVGANAGTVFRIPYLNKPVTLGPNAVRVRSKSKILNNDFLYYYLFSRKGQDLLQSIITGSAQPKFNKTSLRGVILSIPAINDQEVIAELMRCIDDRITLLRETNTTLEAIAQALFKSWFVDFDPVHAKQQGRAPEGMDAQTAALFPDSFEESELGMVPKGWSYCSLKEVASIHDSKRIPLSGAERKKRQGKYPYYGAAALMDYVDDYIFDGIYLLTGEDGSVADENGYPITQYVWGRFWVNNHAHILQGKNGVSTEHLMLFLKQTNIQPFITGAVQAKLSQSNMWRINFMRPPLKISEAFGATISPLYEALRHNAEQVESLTELRDTLLPRLISGQLRLPEAQALAQEAMDT